MASKPTNCLLSLAALLLIGCAGNAEQTGFLSTYDNLEPVAPTFRRYLPPDNEMGKYSKFVIDPVETRFYDKQTKIDPKDQQHLTQYMYLAVRRELSQHYELVSDPGPGVARLRIAITNLTAAAPEMSLTPQSKVIGVGAGQASVEAELVDSQTGKQIAAVIDTETGNSFSFSRRSEWGQVEDVMDGWAKRLAKRVDEAHGPAAARKRGG